MRQSWKIFLFLLPISISAQIYAPDTTFRFSASTFKLPAYKFIGVTASNKNYTLAQIQPVSRDANYQTYANTALLDANGQIITNITDGQIIPNSLTDDGFWVNTTQYATEMDSVFHLYYFDISLQKKVSYQLKLKYPVRSIVSIENGCAVFQNIDNYTNVTSYCIYDLEKGFINEINPAKIPEKKFSLEKFYIQELRVDEEKNTWVLAIKSITDTSTTLQLYQVKPYESLSQSNRVFEKTDKELGNRGGSIWNSSNFFENTIVLRRNIDPFKPREVIKIDLQGNILPEISILPLVNNDPNTFFNFINSSKSNYICFRVGQASYYFLDKTGKLTNYKIPTDKYNNVIIEDDKLIYVDDTAEIRVIDIPTLQELKNYKPVPIIDYQPAISNIQTLDNDDYWLGYQNPYQDSKFFTKYSQNKEVFRLEENGVKIYHLSKNNVLIQDINGKIRKFDAANNQTLLPINDNNIVYVDTLYSHIYTNTNGGEINRYFYGGIQDISFKWTGGGVKTDIVVDDNGKIHSLGKRFLSNGNIDPTFQEVDIQLISNGYSTTVFILKKIGNNILMLNGACSMGCLGKIYLWNQEENTIKQINGSFWEYMVQYLQLIRRDSLILVGYNRITPNLQADSGFKIKGIKPIPNYPYSISIPPIKGIDILPNHNLLIASGKELVRYSTKNSLWVEIRNLKGEVSLNDSLLKSGIDLDVFSSDNSAVKLQIENVFDTMKVAYLEGNKLLFTGKEGVIKITAKSVKGGTPFEIQFPINDWRLKTSTIKISPSDTTLYTGFKPFPIIIKSDNNLPLIIKTEGGGAYLKDGIIYPTEKRGFLNINVSHGQINGYRANSQTFNFWINQSQQKIYYAGMDTLTNTYYLPESAFPFKIPVQTSSKLPIRYTLSNGNLYQIFHVSNDSIYLNPDYKKLIQVINTGYSPIGFMINGYQSGNNAFQATYFSVNIQLLLPQEEPILAPLEVFPNPFDTYINIYCPNKENITEAAIYDITGKLIKKYSINNDNYVQFQFPFYSLMKEVVLLSTDDIPKGNYLLFFTANNQKITKRIIK